MLGSAADKSRRLRRDSDSNAHLVVGPRRHVQPPQALHRERPELRLQGGQHLHRERAPLLVRVVAQQVLHEEPRLVARGEPRQAGGVAEADRLALRLDGVDAAPELVFAVAQQRHHRHRQPLVLHHAVDAQRRVAGPGRKRRARPEVAAQPRGEGHEHQQLQRQQPLAALEPLRLPPQRLVGRRARGGGSRQAVALQRQQPRLLRLEAQRRRVADHALRAPQRRVEAAVAQVLVAHQGQQLRAHQRVQLHQALRQAEQVHARDPLLVVDAGQPRAVDARRVARVARPDQPRLELAAHPQRPGIRGQHQVGDQVLAVLVAEPGGHLRQEQLLLRAHRADLWEQRPQQ
ncbi:uncharacterized protein BcabD6B2_09350 [Babesia caballi]|uniref:Uncharacterized protein n=1 Tax=Babesia caballi TaxID=5871 RepID=A0AAV4LPS7_BABCB|nr:hypothetical protein BcabD6B2_09350 [Babesia caballi]